MSRLRNDKMRKKVNALRARGLTYWEISQLLNIQYPRVAYYASNQIETRKNKRKLLQQTKVNVSMPENTA